MTLAEYLSWLAGADPTLPARAVDPSKEWSFRLFGGEPVMRLVRVVAFRDDEHDLRTKYTLITGHYLLNADVVHTYPKDQWTEAEATEHCATVSVGRSRRKLVDVFEKTPDSTD